MPMHEFWFSTVSQGLFWLAGMFVLTRWLGRSRLRARPPQDAHRMVQPVGILLLAVLLLVMMAGAMIGSFIWPDQEPTPFWAYLILLAMVALSLYLIADYRYARHTVSDSGMGYGRAFGGRGSFVWNEVGHVGFNKHMNWYRLTLESGNTVRISALLMGQPEFARAVLQHVPAARIDAATRTMLYDASNHKLPPVWK
jgi:hypothetical protein